MILRKNKGWAEHFHFQKQNFRLGNTLLVILQEKHKTSWCFSLIPPSFKTAICVIPSILTLAVANASDGWTTSTCPPSRPIPHRHFQDSRMVKFLTYEASTSLNMRRTSFHAQNYTKWADFHCEALKNAMGMRETSVIFALSAADRKRWHCIEALIDQFDNGLLAPDSVCKLAQGLLSKVGMAEIIQVSEKKWKQY